MNLKSINKHLDTKTSAAPLSIFRIGFGLMMLWSIIRFWSKGWIDKIYIQPNFHFKYYGFEWVQTLGVYNYGLFFICGLSAFLIMIGFKYRLAIITFFLSFTYIELIEKTTYLNHYYFISVLSFLMIFLPANAYFSLDNYLKKVEYKTIPKWCIDSIKLLLGIVYVYAGLAKINSDWLLNAQPLKIWLTSKYNIPLIGETLMHKDWFHFAMSWSGMLYDLSIPFLLLFKKTRSFAFVLVVIFHVFTRVLFEIGMFPYIMIISTLIFFEPSFHEKIILKIKRGLLFFKLKTNEVLEQKQYVIKKRKATLAIVSIFFVLQLLLPWRYLLYPGELFWTEEGYRFSWRVMLMEKAGYAQFKIVNSETGHFFYVSNSDFLTPLQEKQMSFQPDFILEYAHYLGDHFKSQGHQNIQVFVNCQVALNGRMSQPYINPKVDLYKISDSFQHKDWILPFQDEIKGL